MTQSSSAYAGVVSLRSRRLRTLGVLLVAALLAMSLYGVLALMPAMKSATQIYNTEIQKTKETSAAASVESARTLRRVKRVMAVKLLFADAYWMACGILAVAAVFVAWLDFREVSWHYREQRRALLSESVQSIPVSEDASE